MQSSAYFFEGSKSAGLINTPSIIAPSWLFHEMSSRVPRVNCLACSVMFVRARGEKLFTSEMNISFSETGELAEKAIRCPSRVREKPPAIKLSGPVMRVIRAV